MSMDGIGPPQNEGDKVFSSDSVQKSEPSSTNSSPRNSIDSDSSDERASSIAQSILSHQPVVYRRESNNTKVAVEYSGSEKAFEATQGDFPRRVFQNRLEFQGINYEGFEPKEMLDKLFDKIGISRRQREDQQCLKDILRNRGLSTKEIEKIFGVYFLGIVEIANTETFRKGVELCLLSEGFFEATNNENSTEILKSLEEDPDYSQEKPELQENILRALLQAAHLEGKGFSQDEVSMMIQGMYGQGIEYYRTLFNAGLSHQDILKVMELSGQSFGALIMKLPLDDIMSKTNDRFLVFPLNEYDSEEWCNVFHIGPDRNDVISIAVEGKETNMNMELYMKIIDAKDPTQIVGYAKIEGNVYPLDPSPEIKVSWELAIESQYL